MRYIQFIFYAALFLVLLSFAWPLLIGFFIFLFALYVYTKWTLRKVAAQKPKQETYEAVHEKEMPNSNLEEIDLEYEEKE